MIDRRILQFFGVLSLLVILGMGLYLNFHREREIVPVETRRVTIPEGYTVKQIGDALEKAGMFSASEFVAQAGKDEGYLFPDTYEFYKDAPAESVITKMRQNFDAKALAKIAGDLDREKKSLGDVVVMASILEEEAASSTDRKIISGILWKRIDAGMPLQVDATLNYITGITSRDLSDDDLKLEDPYNTYVFKGLPPGPISNPGLDSLTAALNPTETQYWYYLSDSKGIIHYAKTFEQHKINKQKYIR